MHSMGQPSVFEAAPFVPPGRHVSGVARTTLKRRCYAPQVPSGLRTPFIAPLPLRHSERSEESLLVGVTFGSAINVQPGRAVGCEWWTKP